MRAYKRLIIIPCYKREETTEAILRTYSDLSDTKLIVSLQQYSDEFLERVKDVLKKDNVEVLYLDKVLSMGLLRIKLLSMNKVSDYEFVTMHDNDFILDKLDIEMLERELGDSELYFSAPDLQGLSGKEYMVEGRLAASCICLKGKPLEKVIPKLSEIEASEDSEMIYLLGNSGVLINTKYFETKFPDVTDDTIIVDKLKKLEDSAIYLQEKYGENIVTILKRPSGKHFVIFYKIRPFILILDGMDRSGKTSVIDMINKQTGYTPVIIDRGPIGYKAYGELYNKENRPEDYDIMEEQLKGVDHLCVYLYADEEVIEQRCRDTSEKEMPFGVKKNKELYDKYFEESTLHKISFDSGRYSTEEIVKMIFDKIKKWQNLK